MQFAGKRRMWTTGVIGVALAAAAVVALIAPGQAKTSAQGAPQVEITIRDFAFSPPSLVVPPGTPVRWTNLDTLPHRVAAVNGAFESDNLTAGQTFTLTRVPPLTGLYEYFCRIHPTMRGTVLFSSQGGTAAPGIETAPVLTPNGGWTLGANQVVAQGQGTAAVFAAVAEADSNRKVTVVWRLTAGAWLYFIRTFPGASTLTNIAGPVSSLIIVLE